MKKEAQQYFLKHGTIEGYYEKQVKDNDRKWFLALITVCVMFIGFYSINNKTQADVKVEARRLADSLQVCYQGKLDSITTYLNYEPSKQIKCKTDQQQVQQTHIQD